MSLLTLGVLDTDHQPAFLNWNVQPWEALDRQVETRTLSTMTTTSSGPVPAPSPSSFHTAPAAELVLHAIWLTVLWSGMTWHSYVPPINTFCSPVNVRGDG